MLLRRLKYRSQAKHPRKGKTTREVEEWLLQIPDGRHAARNRYNGCDRGTPLCVCMVGMALIIAMVLCSRSQDLFVNVRTLGACRVSYSTTAHIAFGRRILDDLISRWRNAVSHDIKCRKGLAPSTKFVTLLFATRQQQRLLRDNSIVRYAPSATFPKRQQLRLLRANSEICYAPIASYTASIQQCVLSVNSKVCCVTTATCTKRLQQRLLRASNSVCYEPTATFAACQQRCLIRTNSNM